MPATERNIEERPEALSFEFRNQRQEAIDAELLGIGADFEAVGAEARGPDETKS